MRLLWELRLERDGFSVEAALQKGRELPDWYTEGPASVPGDEFYLRAFRELSTCRPGGGLYPIPWTSIVEYGHIAQLDFDNMRLFIEAIRAMDVAFLKWEAEQTDRRRAASAPPEDGRTLVRP